MKNVLLLLGILFLWVFQVNAQWSITDVETQFTIDFATTVNGVNNGVFSGDGFAENPSSGQLDAHAWAANLSPALFKDFGEEAVESIYALGSSGGGVTTGGIYAFEVEPGNYALGIQPTGTVFTPGWLGLKIVNNTGETVDHVEFSYDVWVYNDQNRSQTFNGEFSLDGEIWQSVEELEFVTPLDAVLPAQWEKTTLTFDGPLGFELQNGESLYFRWFTDDFAGGGARDEIAIDNINIIVTPVGGCNITEFPYLQNFDGVFPPECWENNLWEQSTYGTAYSGSEWAYSNTTGSELTTPEFVVPAVGSYIFSFWYRAESASNPQNMDIEMSTDGENFVNIESFVGLNVATYQQFTYDLSAYAGQSVWFRFVGLSGSGGFSWGVLVDHVEVRQLSDENDILEFTLAEQYEPAVIDFGNHMVNVVVQMGTDLSALTPDIVVSENATISPESGVTLDFTNPVTYTVTSESQLEQDWIVTVIESETQSNENDILTFSFPQQTGPAVIDTEEKTVDIEINWLANITNLTPSITVSTFATINPESGVAQDFSSPFTYTVTAENEEEAIWTINVSLS